MADIPFVERMGTGPSGRGSHRGSYQTSFNPN